MIIVKLIGGLGNQMFQYAAAKKLALSHGVELKLDITEFENRYKLRKYELGDFNIDSRTATQKDFLWLHCSPSKIYRRIYKFFRLFGININKKFILETPGSFPSGPVGQEGNAYLAFGYWADRRYFKEIDNQIKKEFTLRSEMDEKNKSLLGDIKSSDSVAVHVRRGDFVDLGATLGNDYYERAIDFIGKKIKDPSYFIFSDDISWVKNNLKIIGRAIYIDSALGERTSAIDLYLISQCKNQICANSTFSWWGAYLNTNPEAIKVFPKNWPMEMDGTARL